MLNTPVAVAAANSTKEAGKLLGWDVELIPTDPTPAGVISSWDTAVQLKPDVVFSTAFPPSLFQSQMDTLKAGGTKIVGYSIGDETTPAPGFDYETATNAATGAWMRLAADEIAVKQAGEPAKIAAFWLPDFPSQESMKKEFNDEINTVCEGCEVDNVSLNTADIGTEVPSQIVSYLQRNPDTDYLAFGYTPMITGVGDAVKRAGVGENIKGVLSEAGEASDWDTMGPDGFLTFNVAFSTAQLGYQLMDASLRLMAGMPTTPGFEKYESPIFIVTDENIDEFRARDYAFNPNYVEQYKALWGVQ
jgi:ribose transport system substrate-binding protein